MKKLLALGLLALAFVAVPCAAQQQVAYTAKDVHLRAGPARDYPVIAILPPGFAVAVQGCLSDYSWCDVIAGTDRGWVYAANLAYPYQGGQVPLIEYGPQLGIVVTPFFFFDYWDRHYRDRPFYPHRDRWAHRPRPPHPPVAPQPVPGVPQLPPAGVPPLPPAGVPRPPPQHFPTPGELPRPPQHGVPGPRPQPPPQGQPPRPPQSEGPAVVKPRPQ